MSADAPALTNAPGPDPGGLHGNEPKLNEALKAEEIKGIEVITEAYVKLSTIQWEWPKRLPKWQRNAIHSLVMSEPLLHPDHSLREPGSEGLRLYNVTDSDGCTRVSMSLRQLEYLQYYIHELRLADPVWTRHLTSVVEAQKTEADKQVGPAEYPPGEEWIPLPDEFVFGDNLVKAEPIYFDDVKELKRCQSRQHSSNRRVRTKKMRADDRDFEAARERILRSKAKAQEIGEEEGRTVREDNETEGPGLRRGPERRQHRAGPPARRDAEENDDESESGQNRPNVGCGGFPLVKEEGTVETAKTLIDMEHLTLGGPVAKPSKTSTAASSALSSPDPKPVSNFTSAYYEHAQQALLIATLGGMFEAQRGQLEYLNELANLSETASTGRSLFISIRAVTWEADGSTVLEVGWSAIWWQERLDAGAASDHRPAEDKIADHLAHKANGTWKPNYRNDYQFGNSLPIASKDAVRTLLEKIKDLSIKAGGGPTYIIMHSTDGTHADLSKIGLATQGWYAQFKPPHWDYPCYACVDGIGKTFIIDTAILLAAVEHAPASGPAPIKTDLTMEEAAWFLFNKDDARRPHFCGNAGNDAFYNLELFIALVTAPSLDTLHEDFKKAKAAPKPVAPNPVEVSSDDTVVGDSNHQAGKDTASDADAVAKPHDDQLYEDDDDECSEDERIMGVYAYGSDGELIQLD